MQLAQVIPIKNIICAGCGVEKSYSEFTKRRFKKKSGVGYSHGRCKECSNKEDRLRYKLNKRKSAKSINYKNKYGITLDEAQLMLNDQMGLCANRGCGKELSLNVGLGLSRSACLDHCHETGKIRAFLCMRCNTTLGMLENKNVVLGLTEYLKKYGSN